MTPFGPGSTLLALPLGGPWLAWWADGGAFRLWTEGPGVSWTRRPPLYSERSGRRRPFLRLGAWRAFLLPGAP